MWRLKQHNNKQIREMLIIMDQTFIHSRTEAQARLASCRKEQPIEEDAQFAEPEWVCLFVCFGIVVIVGCVF